MMHGCVSASVHPSTSGADVQHRLCVFPASLHRHQPEQSCCGGGGLNLTENKSDRSPSHWLESGSAAEILHAAGD